MLSDHYTWCRTTMTSRRWGFMDTVNIVEFATAKKSIPPYSWPKRETNYGKYKCLICFVLQIGKLKCIRSIKLFMLMRSIKIALKDGLLLTFWHLIWKNNWGCEKFCNCISFHKEAIFPMLMRWTECAASERGGGVASRQRKKRGFY